MKKISTLDVNVRREIPTPLNNLEKQILQKCTGFDMILSKKDGKDQESIQSSITPDPGYHMGK